MKRTAANPELDSMIVEIELTLISIIQGVALTFLIESARNVMSFGQMIFWPYVISGLLVIFVFWSRSVLHIITVIRWPLEFGHNFFYIACALIEALLFTKLTNPSGWFALTAVFGAIGWLLFFYDLRLIRARAQDSVGEASRRLIEVVTRDQWLNIAVLLPAVIVFNLVCFAMLRFRPSPFLPGQLHVWLAACQLGGFGGYLLYVVRHFKVLTPLIGAARNEWRAE